jgi:hypothetical protein
LKQSGVNFISLDDPVLTFGIFASFAPLVADQSVVNQCFPSSWTRGFLFGEAGSRNSITTDDGDYYGKTTLSRVEGHQNQNP